MKRIKGLNFGPLDSEQLVLFCFVLSQHDSYLLSLLFFEDNKNYYAKKYISQYLFFSRHPNR